MAELDPLQNPKTGGGHKPEQEKRDGAEHRARQQRDPTPNPRDKPQDTEDAADPDSNRPGTNAGQLNYPVILRERRVGKTVNERRHRAV